AALDSAAQNAGADRVFLGAATYTAPAQGFIYDPMNSDDPVEIVGAGTQATVLEGTSGAYRTLAVFGGSGTSVHDLGVVMPPNAPDGAQALRSNGVLRHVSVYEVVAQQQNVRAGVVLLGSGVLEDGFVGLQDADPTAGVVLLGGGTVRNSTVYAARGVTTGGGTIDRSYIGASVAGVSIQHGTTKITSTAIVTSAYGSVGIVANGDLDGDAFIDVDGVTLAGPDNAQSGTAFEVENTYVPTVKVDAVVKNTLIRSYPATFWAGGTAPGHGHIDVSYSDYDPSNDHVAGATGSLSEQHTSYTGNALFGNEPFVPLPGSPLTDAGDPATGQGLDVDGNPLVTDGDGDGIARRDIGAFELPAVPLKPSADALPAGGASGAGEQPPATPPVVPARDTLAPALSGLRFNHKVFAVGRAPTAIAARAASGTRLSYKLSESAKVVVKIRRVGSKRAAGTLTRRAKSGNSAIAFSGRIGAKALKAGRYRAVITATDAAGNRSPAKSVSFRIVKR
ncbi:MAG TPA: hypothetical protein VH279_14345, partial [Solirubrobacteraceae bacterium]|nr:hypothetical protein [Solirubrobacteraceae bacterium]